MEDDFCLSSYLDSIEYLPPIGETVKDMPQHHSWQATGRTGSCPYRRPAVAQRLQTVPSRRFPRWSTDPVKQARREFVAFNAYLDHLLGKTPDGRRWPYRAFGCKKATQAAEFARGLKFDAPGTSI